MDINTTAPESGSQPPAPFSEMDKMMQETSPSGGAGFWAFIREMAKITIIALVIILPVRYFLIKPFYVNGASMIPSYYDGEYLIVDEISYRLGDPQRGDVIVFRYPADRSQFFIKRIIGLPGDRVVIGGGLVTVYPHDQEEGIIIDEPYLLPETPTLSAVDSVLEENNFFVLGDNRNQSLDSRRFGPLERKDIVGRVWLRGWPLDRLGVLGHYEFGY